VGRDTVLNTAGKGRKRDGKQCKLQEEIQNTSVEQEEKLTTGKAGRDALTGKRQEERLNAGEGQEERQNITGKALKGTEYRVKVRRRF
jgi:hypothetical protein